MEIERKIIMEFYDKKGTRFRKLMGEDTRKITFRKGNIHIGSSDDFEIEINENDYEQKRL
ncbi:MAG: hypothetical protein V1728_05210 [Candidatus Micrarchaeota archaeon]